MPTTAPMYAVLITLGGYRHANDLKGAAHDRARLEGFCTGHLGLPAAALRVVATEPGAWQGGTRDDVLDALDWLAEKLADPTATALLHFSGHGTRYHQQGMPESLALCASDYEAGDGPASTRGMVTLQDIAARLGVAALPDPTAFATEEDLVQAYLKALANTRLARVTMTADCCWHDDGEGTSTPTVMPLLTYRMLLGCSRGDVANEVLCEGVPMGAFTWALTVALSRYRVVEVDGNRQMTVTHADLLDRIRSLLDAIDVKDQTPMLGGPRALDLIPVFQRDLAWRDDAPTSRDPDVVDDHRQLWAGEGATRTYYLFWRAVSTDTWSLIGKVVATNDGGTPKNKESWTLSTVKAKDWLTSVQGGTPGSLRFTTGTHTLATPTVSWSYTRATTPSACAAGTVTGTHLYAFDAAAGRAALKFGVTKTETGFTIDSARWWCRTSDLESDSTLDAVFGGSGQTYPNAASITVSTTDSVFPQQTVGVAL